MIIGQNKTCACKPGTLSCLSAKEWVKSQIAVWEFFYEQRDIRDKSVHPAMFPIALPRRVIELFTHEGELVIDPFVGSGSTLIAAQDCNRNAVGFDLSETYLSLCRNRLEVNANLFGNARQVAIQDDARNIHRHVAKESVSLIVTSPPYGNMLNVERQNKSRVSRDRKNKQLGQVEQYSQDDRDLGTLEEHEYIEAMGDIFGSLLPLLRPHAHCVINISDIWRDDKRITLHHSLIDEMRRRGYELRNIIIWDRRKIVNGTGIFGYPKTYIAMGVTFEYILDFWKP